jgi:hypothetical protein
MVYTSLMSLLAKSFLTLDAGQEKNNDSGKNTAGQTSVLAGDLNP